jgi:hypothetical protein
MSTELNFSDEPLDVQQAFDEWEPAPEFAPPPPAGVYQMYLSNLREIKENETKVGKRVFATFDLRISGGQFDDRAINYQRVNNVEFERKDGKKSSFMLDLIKSAGIQQAPRSNKDFANILQNMAEGGPQFTFKAQVDWEGVCSVCRDKSMMASTNTTTLDEAKVAATKDTWDTARKASVKAKNARAFPLNQNGSRKEEFICAECGNQVRAQVKITRFTP